MTSSAPLSMSPQLISSLRRPPTPMTHPVPSDWGSDDAGSTGSTPPTPPRLVGRLSTEDAWALIRRGTYTTFIPPGPRNPDDIPPLVPLYPSEEMEFEDLPPSTQPRRERRNSDDDEYRADSPSRTPREWTMEQFICFMYRGNAVSGTHTLNHSLLMLYRSGFV